MYGIYKRDNGDGNYPVLIATCHTRGAARRACRHFEESYMREHGHLYCEVRYQPIDPYWHIRLGYLILRLTRMYAEYRLSKLEEREIISRTARENQEKKVASLY